MEKGKKPSLGIILAIGKKKPSGGGDADAGADDGYDAGKSPAPECVKCVQHFFEAGADGDYEMATKALATALDHLDADDGEESEREAAEGA